MALTLESTVSLQSVRHWFLAGLSSLCEVSNNLIEVDGPGSLFVSHFVVAFSDQIVFH